MFLVTVILLLRCIEITSSSSNLDIVFRGTRGLLRGTCRWRMCGALLAVARIDNKAVYFPSTIRPPPSPNSQNVHQLKQELLAAGWKRGGAQVREGKVGMYLVLPF